MKRTILALALILSPLLSVAAGTQLVELGVANPLFEGGLVPPDPSAKPPGLSIFAPQNNTVYTTNTLPFSINVSLPASLKAVETRIDQIYYEADWQQNRVYLYSSGTAGFDNQISSSRSDPKNLFFQYSQDFAGIPDGNHSMTVYALGKGSYIEGMYGYGFEINATSSVYFTIDTEPFSAVTVIAVTIAAVVVGVGLLVYLKKHPSKTDPSKTGAKT